MCICNCKSRYPNNSGAKIRTPLRAAMFLLLPLDSQLAHAHCAHGLWICMSQFCAPLHPMSAPLPLLLLSPAMDTDIESSSAREPLCFRHRHTSNNGPREKSDAKEGPKAVQDGSTHKRLDCFWRRQKTYGLVDQNQVVKLQDWTTGVVEMPQSWLSHTLIWVNLVRNV